MQRKTKLLASNAKSLIALSAKKRATDQGIVASRKVKLGLDLAYRTFIDAQGVLAHLKRLVDALKCHVVFAIINGAGRVARTWIQDLMIFLNPFVNSSMPLRSTRKFQLC